MRITGCDGGIIFDFIYFIYITHISGFPQTPLLNCDKLQPKEVQMTGITRSTPTNPALINPGAFARAIIPPLLLWVAVVLFGAVSGQPGVVCITPMAWLLALWSGAQYAARTAGQPLKSPLLGPALLGTVLGIGFGLIFILGISPLAAQEADPAEAAKYPGLTAAIFVGSVLVCALLSTFTAWLTRRRLARSH
jgi:hypothetical protein